MSTATSRSWLIGLAAFTPRAEMLRHAHLAGRGRLLLASSTAVVALLGAVMAALIVLAVRVDAHWLDPDVQITEYRLAGPGNQPFGISAGSDGAVWFAEGATNRVGRIGSDGQVTEYPVPTPDSSPGFLALGLDGAIWFTERCGAKLGRLVPGGQIDEYALPSAGARTGDFCGGAPTTLPNGLAIGPDGAVWVTLQESNLIARVTPHGEPAGEWTIPTPASGPLGITLGPDGAVWFIERSANQIGRLTTDGGFVEYPIPTVDSFPQRIVSGPDGALWFTEYRAQQIGRITLAGDFTEYPVPGSGPAGIVVGPDWALWFADAGGNTVGRITTEGAVSRYPVPTQNSSALINAVGPDGAIWFTERDGNQIGRAELKGQADRQTLTFVWATATDGLSRPIGIATDGAGHLYVHESGKHRIVKLDAMDGHVFTAWGGKGTDPGQFVFRRGVGHVGGVAVDGRGEVFVSDDTGRVQVFDGNGVLLRSWGSKGSGPGQLAWPTGMAIDAQGNLWVADLDNARLVQFSPTGEVLATWGSKGSGDGQFKYAVDVALDATGLIFVTDLGLQRVQKFDASGNLLLKWGSAGTGEGQFHGPENGASGIALDGHGHVYVGDNGGHRIEIFDEAGRFLATWGHFGSGEGEFNYVGSMVIENDGSLYVVDVVGGRIEKFRTR